MPSEVFRLVVDNSQFQKGLKESETQASVSTGAITASLKKIEGGGADGSRGIHLVNNSLKMTRKEITESKGSIAMLGEMLGIHIPRHARGLVASLETIGPALKTAFNAVAVIAIGQAIFEFGKKLYEAFEKGKEAAEKAKTANEEFASSLNKSNLELAVSVDKVEKHIAQLEKKPYNGLKAALDDAALSAVTLAQKLDADIQKERALLQAQDHGFLAQNLGGKAGTSGSQGYLNAYNTGQNDLDVAYQNELDHAKQVGATKADVDAIEQRHLQAKAKLTVDTYNKIKEELEARKEMANLANQTNVQRWQTPGANARLAALQNRFGTTSESIPAMEDLLGNIGMLGHRQQLDATLQSDRTTEANDEERNRMAQVGKQAQTEADRAQMEGFEQRLAAMKLAHQVTVSEEMNFWTVMQSQTRDGSANWLAINKKLGEENQQVLAKVHTGFDAVRKGQQKDLAEQVPGGDVAAEWRAADYKATQQLGVETQKGADIQHKFWVELQATNIELAVASGHMTRQQGAVTIAKLHTDEWTQALKELNSELRAIDNDPTLSANDKALAKAKVQSKIATVTGEQALGTAKDSAAANPLGIADTLRKNLKDTYSPDNLPNQMKNLQDQFLQGMNSNITNLLIGEKTNWAQFLKQLAGSLVSTGLNALMGAGMSFLPHFADGGYTGTGPVLVGERGPEIANFSRGAYITPNGRTGANAAGAFYYIDAKEGDTATLSRNMMRGLQAVHGQAVEDANTVLREKQARMPRGAF